MVEKKSCHSYIILKRQNEIISKNGRNGRVSTNFTSITYKRRFEVYSVYLIKMIFYYSSLYKQTGKFMYFMSRNSIFHRS